MREAASRSRVTLIPVLLDSPLDEPAYRRAFAALAAERAEALLVSDHAEALAHQRLIVDLAAQARLPAIYAYRSFVELGGLAAYAADQQDIARQVADYIDRILKGARPAELPFQQPTKFELVLNMKTARALKLTLPPSLLVRATGVIE
jgi:putative ABC transport system substrate-binding protein